MRNHHSFWSESNCLKICCAISSLVFSKDLNFFLISSRDFDILVAMREKSHPYFRRLIFSYSTSNSDQIDTFLLFPFLILLNLTSHPEIQAAMEEIASVVARLLEWCSCELFSQAASTPWGVGLLLSQMVLLTKFNVHNLININKFFYIVQKIALGYQSMHWWELIALVSK